MNTYDNNFSQTNLSANNEPRNPKPKKSKKAAAVIAVLLVLAVIGGTAAVIIKNHDNTSSSVSSFEKENSKIKYSGIVHNGEIFTFENTDYCLGEDKKIYAVTENERTPLSEQENILSFTIINDTIYYNVIEKTEPANYEYGIIDAKIPTSSCWKMNLDGTNAEKVIESVEFLSDIIYANDENIYCSGLLTDSDEDRANHWGDSLYKYNIESKQATNITHKDACAVSFEFTYVDGYIIYNPFHSDPSCTPLYSYDIAKDKTKDTGFDIGEIVRLDNTTVLISKSGHNQRENNITDKPALFEYSPKNGTTKIISEAKDLDHDFWTILAKSKLNDKVFVSSYEYDASLEQETTTYYTYTKNGNLEKADPEINPNAIFQTENGVYLLNADFDFEEYTLCLRSNDGTEKEIYTSDNYISAVGKNVLIEEIFNEATTDYSYKIVDIPIPA